jgi:hypothetical protein
MTVMRNGWIQCMYFDWAFWMTSALGWLAGLIGIGDGMCIGWRCAWIYESMDMGWSDVLASSLHESGMIDSM